MAKAKKLLSLSLTAAMLSAGAAAPVQAQEVDPIAAVSKDGVAFRLGMIGDSHVTVDGTRKEYFEQAVTTLKDTIGGIDAYGLNGDIVYYSKYASTPVNTANYDYVNSILEANSIGRDEGETPFIASMGNHEFPESQNNAAICEEYVTAYETKFEQGLDHHIEVNGYHIIASGGRTYNLIDLKDTDGDGVGDTLVNSEEYYNTNEEWIMSEIEAIKAADDYDANKPIFLMLHHAIQKTTGQIANPMPTRYSAAFKAYLNENPNVVNLVGHTHISAQHPDSIWQDGFTVYQTPLTGTYGSAVHQTSFVDVTTDNKVKIYKIDMNSGSFIGEPWVIDIPAGKESFQYTEALRTDTAAPTFAADAAITIDAVDDYSVTLSYPTGICESTGAFQDGIVSKHTIVITDKETGRVAKTSDYGASYNVIPQPEVQTKTITGLSPGTTYTVSVTPKSILNVSGAAITTEFTTAGEKASVEVGENIELTFDENLVGGTIETTTTDEEGNETTTSRKAYEAILDNGVRISPRTIIDGKSHPYFTYVLNVGEGEEIEEAGVYRISHRYALQKASAAVVMSVKHPGSENFVPMVKRGFSSTGNHSTWKTVAKDDYITLKEGENILKVQAASVEGNDAIDMELPILAKVTSGAIVDYVLNNTYTVTDASTTDSGYQTSTYIGARSKDYFTVPIEVPHTAAYKMEISVGTANDTSKFTVAYGESQDALDKTITSATFPAASTSRYSFYTNIITNSVVLEAGKTYYFKFTATVGNNDLALMDKIRLTDTGAALSALSVTGGTLSPEFSGNIKDYTVTVPMPSSGSLADVIVATPVDSSAAVTIGDATVNYGINEKVISVTVTGADGVKQGEYRIKAIVSSDILTVSKDCAADRLYNSSSELSVGGATTLFDGSGITKWTSGTGHPYRVNAGGYIQVDLGENYDDYKLTQFEVRRGVAGYLNKVITVLASNDPEFTDGTYVTIGATDATETYLANKLYKAECELNSTTKYRYIRISPASDIYPIRMNIYGYKDVSANVAEDTLTTTVTVPSQYYAVGDSVIAATYDSKGVLTGIKFGEAQNASTTEVVVTKKNAADTVKAMVWTDVNGMAPRSEAMAAN